MLFSIVHHTTYTYPCPVRLTPHAIRLRPQTTARQTLLTFDQKVTPGPTRSFHLSDLDGNQVSKLIFESPTDRLNVETRSQVETHVSNPFNFILEPWAVSLPIDYPTSLRLQLQPYLEESGFDDAIAAQLARDLWGEVEGNTVAFASALCQRIHQQCRYILRETGEPYPPGLTWQQKCGSCRDFAVLFAAACRAAKLAARFVSGYEAGDPNSDAHHLHAWAEVYLPGAGWRGFDPTLGLAVADRHVALASSPYPSYAAPIVGGFRDSNLPAGMEYSVRVREMRADNLQNQAQQLTQTQPAQTMRVAEST